MTPAPDLATAAIQLIIIIAVIWLITSIILWGTISVGMRWIDWALYTGVLLLVIYYLRHIPT